MNWEIYSNNFTSEAIKSGLSKNEISICLHYAKSIFERNLPVIFDHIHFSLLVGYSIEYILSASNSPKNYYRTFEIPKKSGGTRQISEPYPSLKEIQRWILDNILYKCNVNKFAKAYLPNTSIRDNARFHINQRIVLSVDIKDFFPSLKFGKVFSLFSKMGYSKAISTLLSNLCCLNKSLPQGSPTSPAISNLLMSRVDARLAGYSVKNRIRYTRYADDITISGDYLPGQLIKFVGYVLDEEGLRINTKKIRTRKRHQRQEVTGIVVNKKMQVPRDIRRKVRQSVYYIKKYGLDSHLDFTNNFRANHVRHLMGLLNFILYINPNDSDALEQKEFLLQFLQMD